MSATASSSSAQRGVCVVVGVGPGNGSALAQRFSSAGHPVALLARRTGTSQSLAASLPNARAYACDITDPQAIQHTFQSIPTDLGTHIDTVIYNAGSGSWGTIDEVNEQHFEAAWRTNAYGAFVVTKAVLDGMKQRGSGSIIFIGATSSRRGMPFTTAFAPAKAAQRILAESLARTLWPKGIHVGLLVIDGAVDIPGKDHGTLKDKPKEFFVQPSDVAEQAFVMANQPRSTWTFEMEVRPFGEKW